MRAPSLLIFVGAGGVGKTTLAAGTAVAAARAGLDTLVMTFDPSRRLRGVLGLRPGGGDAPIRVPIGGTARLEAGLLDAKATFDRVVALHSPDAASRERIYRNRFYRDLSGTLAGILEYMAVERLYEIAAEGSRDLVILDTPPARQAMDFLGAPSRITEFLDSGAIDFALRPWFDAEGRFRAAERLGPIGRGLERLLDRIVGIDLLRDLAEFFQAFAPMYAGFRERAERVAALLRDPSTGFVLVGSPGPDRVADTMLFARKLREGRHGLRAVVANRVHPESREGRAPGERVRAWLGRRDRSGVDALRALVGDALPVIEVLAEDPPPEGPESLSRIAQPLLTVLK